VKQALFLFVGLDAQSILSEHDAMTKKSHNRPVFLDLTRIQMPIPAIVSILHRLTGLLLILMVPFLLCLLETSLSGSEGYASVMSLSLPALLVGLFVIWGLFHHLFSGIRFLLIDLDIGVDRATARGSAAAVLAAGVVATILLLVIWL